MFHRADICKRRIEIGGLWNECLVFVSVTSNKIWNDARMERQNRRKNVGHFKCQCLTNVIVEVPKRELIWLLKGRYRTDNVS